MLCINHGKLGDCWIGNFSKTLKAFIFEDGIGSDEILIFYIFSLEYYHLEVPHFVVELSFDISR